MPAVCVTSAAIGYSPAAAVVGAPSDERATVMSPGATRLPSVTSYSSPKNSNSSPYCFVCGLG